MTRASPSGYAASTSGPRRLLLVEDNPGDAVLLDLRLPDGTGIENIESVQRVAGDLPVVVLAGTDRRVRAR